MSTSTSSRARSWRPARTAAIAGGLVLALLVAAVWVVPGMLDWNRYRASVAGLVAAAIGRPVTIDGDITLTLLPQPILTATRLKVDDPAAGVALSTREVRLRVALGPLLAGRVDARELTMRGADLRLPWPPPAGALARRPPVWLASLQARVEQSRLQVGDLVASDIDASLSSDPETGTVALAGSARLFGLTWHVTTRVGRPGGDGSAPLDISLDGQDRLRDTGGTFSGVLGADGALAGRIAARGPDLSQIIPAPAMAWRGDGRLTAQGGLAIADELALEIGRTPARGAVALRVQPDLRLDIALSAGQFDVDAWVPILARVAQAGNEPPFPLGIDLTAEAAPLAGGTLRQLRCALDIDRDGIGVREAGAFLPGDAKLTVLGRFPRAERSPAFDGSVALIAPNLPDTMRWLGALLPGRLSGLPEAGLRTAELSAKVTLQSQLLSLVDLQGRMGGTAAQGAVSGGLAVRLGPRLGFSASLALDRMALDPFLPEPSSLASLSGDYARLVQLVAALPFDADLKLQLQQASWSGLELGPLSLDAQAEVGRVTLRRLEASADGVRATVSGAMGEGGRISEGRLEVSTQAVERLRALLPRGLALPPALLRGPASALVQVAGPPEAMGFRATAELGDLRAEAQPVLNVAARRWTGPVTLHHPGAPRLLERLDVPGTAAWLGDGSFSVIAQATVAPGRVELGDVEMVAGTLRASGQLSVADGRMAGRVHAEMLPLPGFYARSPDPLPVGALRLGTGSVHLEADQVLTGLSPLLRNLSADVGLEGGVLSLRNVAANLAGGAVTGSASLDAAEKPKLQASVRLSDVAVGGPVLGGSLDVAGGTLQAVAALSAEGYSPAAMTATLAGSARVEVDGASVSGIDLDAVRSALDGSPAGEGLPEAALRAALTAGTTVLDRLTVGLTAARGIVSVSASGRGASGEAALDGTVDLPGNTMEARLALRPSGGLPEVAARLTGVAADPARTPELAAAARWLAERP